LGLKHHLNRVNQYKSSLFLFWQLKITFPFKSYLRIFHPIQPSQMTKEEIRFKLIQIKKWRQGDIRAPHKPLLLLMYLARLSRGITKPLSFGETEEELTDLLKTFGPSRDKYKAFEPFVRLGNDGIWNLTPQVNNKSVSISELRSVNPIGELIPEIQRVLVKDPLFLEECVQLLLDDNFPDSIHEEIRSAIGLTNKMVLVKKSTRDPKFREEVLKAYEYTCAVCGFNLRIKNALAGVEAAHVKWHAMNGPDTLSNGLALCTMHHKLFDLGAMGINVNMQLTVSPQTNGAGKELWLNRFEGKPIRSPQKSYALPSDVFLAWHEKEVFKW
jgi:putative restriction endonuclease